VKLAAEVDIWGRVADRAADEIWKQRWHRLGLMGAAHLSAKRTEKSPKRVVASGIRTQDLL
jgi:hypothetical protein